METLYEKLVLRYAAEIITTVDNEMIFLYHDSRLAHEIIAEELGLRTDDDNHYYGEDICRAIIEAAAADGYDRTEDMSYYEPEDRLRMDQIIQLLYAADEGHAEEYECCDDCGLWVYTSATSYCDRGRFTRSMDGDITCRSCCKKNPERHLEEYLDARGETAFILDPSLLGFEQVNEDAFQNGLHHGMADDPKAQRKLLRKAGIHDVIMTIEPSQFYVDWTVWVRPEHAAATCCLLVHKGELWTAPNGALLIFTASATIGDEVWAYYRESSAAPWQEAKWSYGDEERWYVLWKRKPDEVYEFDYLTEETWNDRRCIALCRFNAYSPTESWTKVSVDLRQNPSPAQNMERVLRGTRLS